MRAYPVAIEMLKVSKCWQPRQLRQVKYFNNLIEQDHREY